MRTLKLSLGRTAGALASALACLLAASGGAEAALTVTPITWNVIGLDSNTPASGPRVFPVGARVCSDVATGSAVNAAFTWDSANAYVDLRPGSLTSMSLGALGAGACADAYFEAEIQPVAAAYGSRRSFHITASYGAISASTPRPRELFVERLVSQNRNATLSLTLNGSPVVSGGGMNLVVGNTYTIQLIGSTATGGYEQLESFISFPNTIFQILAVSTTYSANATVAPNVVPNPNDRLYGDACGWQSDPTSPAYRSCTGSGKVGNSVTTTYTIRIVGGGGTSSVLSSMLYDFSGSSFHYNANYSTFTVNAAVTDPGSNLAFSKAFSPASTVAGGTSTLTFTLANSSSNAIGGLAFSDPLPAVSGGQMVVATPATFSTSGCGSPAFSPTAGATSLSFANGSVAGNSSCTVSVRVQVPAAPTSGTYANTSGNVFVSGVDSGRSASANLALSAATPGTGICNVTLARWNFNGYTANPIPGPSTVASDVGVAAITTGNGLTGTPDTSASGGSPQPGLLTYGWQKVSPIVTTTSGYVQVAIDASKYSAVKLQLDAQRKANGPTTSSIYTSTDGTNFTPLTTFSSTTGWATYPSAGTFFDLTGVTSPTGTTYVRIYGYGANATSPGNDISFDNVSFTGCGSPAQPTLAKAFSPAVVAVNGVSTLTFTLSNPNPSVALNGVRFTDSLPAGVQVAATPAFSTTCSAPVPSWTGSGSNLSFGQATGAALPAAGSCTASVNVTATTAGPHPNVSGFVSSTESGVNSGAGGSAVASLTALQPPALQKSFGTNPILAGQGSVLTFRITNPNPDDALAGIAFLDTYPGGLVNAATPAVTNGCGGAVTAVAGAGSLNLAGGALAAGASCTIAVTVTAAAAGSYANTSGAVSATTAGTGNAASATLSVRLPSPSIGLLKQVSTSPTGPWVAFLSAAPGTALYYRFTVENTGDVALSPIEVNDPRVDASACAWPASLPVASAVDDPTASCVVGPVTGLSGQQLNTATAQGAYAGTTYTSAGSTASFFGAAPGFSLVKEIGRSPAGPWSASLRTLAGASVHYRFTLVNTGNVALTGAAVNDAQVSAAACAFSDPLPVGGASACIVGPVASAGGVGTTATNTATGSGTGSSGAVTTPASSASYTISAAGADLSVTKTGPAQVGVGGSVSYSIVVTNDGPSAADGAVLADPAVANFAASQVVCSLAAGGAVCPGSASPAAIQAGLALPTLPAGGSLTFTVMGAAGAGGTITNAATIAPPGGTTDPNPANDAATASTTILASADMSVSLSGFPAVASPGATVTGTVTCTNTAASAASGALCQVSGLPVGASVTCTPTSPQASLAGSGTISCAVSYVAPTSGTNTIAGVTGAVNDGNAANDSATTAVAVIAAVNDGTSTVTYAVSGATTFDLLGNDTVGTVAAAIGVNIAVPGIDSNGGLTGAAIDGTGRLSVPNGTPAGTYTVQYRICSQAVPTACATATKVVQVVVQPADMSVALSGFPAAAGPGSTVTGTVTCTNVDASAAALGATCVVSGLPAGAVVNCSPVSPQASLAAGSAITCSVSYTAPSTGATTIGGTTGATNDGNGFNDSASDVVAIVDAVDDGSTVVLQAASGTTTLNLLGNDTIGGAAAIVAVGISVPVILGDGGLVGLSVDASGGLVVPNNAPTGTYTVTYRICSLAVPTACDTATKSIVLQVPAGLTVTKTHAGSFVAGSTGNAYTVTVTNAGGTPTAGTVTLSDAPPAGMTVTAMSGTGWTCTTLPTCTRSDALAAGASYPALTVTVSVAANATTPLVNTVTVSGGGSPNASASDSTVITQPTGLTVAKAHTGSFAAGSTGNAYTVTVTNAGGTPTAGTVTLTDAPPVGMTVTAMAGTGWTCATLPTCTRSDALAAGASYPSLTVTVSIAANATSPLVNSVTVSGGGFPPATATDPTVIALADMRVVLSGFPASTGPGIAVSGRVTCTNAGSVPAAGATCTIVSGATASNCTVGGSPVALPVASLAPGASLQCDARATAPASGTLTIVASTTATNDSGTTGKTATQAITVSTTPGSGRISGVVWYDLDRNRVPEASEPRRGGWGVELMSGGTTIASTATAPDGSYQFTALAPGNYDVRFINPSGLPLPSGPMPVNGDPGGNGGVPTVSQLSNIVVAVGGTVVNQSLPIDPSGVVYDSATRVPIGGATVTLLRNGTPVDPSWVAGGSATQTTAVGGYYAFFLLPAAPAGTYGLSATAPSYGGTPSLAIPPTVAPPGFTGGSVGYAGAPPAGQATTYYLSFARPTVDILNNNIPLDPGAAATPVPSSSEWSLILTALLMVLGAWRARHPGRSSARRGTMAG